MNTSSAALARNTLFFAQGGLFALLMATIPGLYLPRGPMLLAGAALGLCGLGLVFLVVRAGETRGIRQKFLVLTGISAAGITLGAILHNVGAALHSFTLGVFFFALALFIFPAMFVASWTASLVLLGTGGRPISKPRKRVAGVVAAVATLAWGGLIAMSIDGEGYSVTSELVGAPQETIVRLVVVAEVDEALLPVFWHSLQHSLVSAFESNGIEAKVQAAPDTGVMPGGDSGDGQAADAVLRIHVEPLYRTHRDGYAALVGTVFDATLVDGATGENAWRLSGKVDYIADRFFRQHGFRAHEGIRKEFAWHTTAAVVRSFMADVAGRESAPIYTDTEARHRHGQRID